MKAVAALAILFFAVLAVCSAAGVQPAKETLKGSAASYYPYGAYPYSAYPYSAYPYSAAYPYAAAGAYPYAAYHHGAYPYYY